MTQRRITQMILLLLMLFFPFISPIPVHFLQGVLFFQHEVVIRQPSAWTLCTLLYVCSRQLVSVAHPPCGILVIYTTLVLFSSVGLRAAPRVR